MNIGKTVVKLRTEKGLTQEALAKKAKLSWPFMSQIESGKRGVRMKTLEKLAKALGVKPGALME